MYDLFLAFALSYLIGSLSFSYLAGKLKGIDLRKEGSGMLGARNVKRVIGKKAAILVLILDLLKGLAGVVLAGMVSKSPLAAMVGWFGVVCGHGWPFYLKFKGGKGLASSLGALLYLSPLTLIAELFLGSLSCFISRNVYLSAILMIVAMPPLLVLTGKGMLSLEISLPIMIAMLLLHRKNMRDIFLKKNKKNG